MSLVARLNTTWHEKALWLFGAIVIGHWLEHLVQAYQVFVLGWARPASRGVLGQVFPWLVTSEWLHYAFAIAMLVGFFLLLPGFTGRARVFWMLALAIQFWHHIEHFLLLYQRVSGDFFFDKPVPTSIAQLVVMRVELHLFYNAIVTIPMLIALLLHMFPPRWEALPLCNCAKRRASRVAVESAASA